MRQEPCPVFSAMARAHNYFCDLADCSHSFSFSKISLHLITQYSTPTPKSVLPKNLDLFDNLPISLRHPRCVLPRMRRIISKVKSKLSSDENGRSSDTEPDQEPIRPPADDRPKMQPPSALEVLRYRYQYGVNLGGIFVLEKWISPGRFESGTQGGSELDAVTA